MKSLLFIAALAMAGLGSGFAEAFGELESIQELGAQAMDRINGQMFTIIVPYNSKGMATVISHEKGDYCTFTVPVTTLAKAANENNKPTNKGKEYQVVPLPSGKYNLGTTQTMSNSSFGTGIHIETSVTTPYKKTNETFNANDFFVHQTSFGNTWGCAGIVNKSGTNAEMAQVLNTFVTSTGSKTIQVMAPPGPKVENLKGYSSCFYK
jgi:hypothetical protein